MSKQILIKEIKKINPEYKRLQEKSKEELNLIYQNLVSTTCTIEDLQKQREAIIMKQNEQYNNQSLDELTEDDEMEDTKMEDSDIDSDKDTNMEDTNMEDDDDGKDKINEYDKYISDTYNCLKPNIRNIQDKLTKYMNKFYKNINKMIDLYCEQDTISDEDYNHIVDYYNEEYEYIEDEYQKNIIYLDSYNMEFTKTFVNYYNKTMTRIEENINYIM